MGSVHRDIVENIIPSVKSGYIPGTRKKARFPIAISGEETGGRQYRVDFGGLDDPDNGSLVMHPHTAQIQITATLKDNAGVDVVSGSNLSLAEGFDSAFFESLELKIDGAQMDSHSDFPIVQHVIDRLFTAHNQDGLDTVAVRYNAQKAQRRIYLDDLSPGGISRTYPARNIGSFCTNDVYDGKEFTITIPMSSLTGFSMRRGRSVLSLANVFSIIGRSNTNRDRWYYGTVNPGTLLPQLHIVEAALVVTTERMDLETTNMLAGFQRTPEGQRLAVDAFRVHPVLPFIPAGVTSHKQSSTIVFPSVPDVIFLIPFSTDRLNANSLFGEYTYKHEPHTINRIMVENAAGEIFRFEGTNNVNGVARSRELMEEYFTKPDGTSTLTVLTSTLNTDLFTIPIIQKANEDLSVTESRPYPITIRFEYTTALTVPISWYVVSRSGRLMQLSFFSGQSGLFV